MLQTLLQPPHIVFVQPHDLYDWSERVHSEAIVVRILQQPTDL